MNDDWGKGWLGNQRGDEDWQDGWIGKCIEYGPLAILCFLFVLQALSK